MNDDFEPYYKRAKIEDKEIESEPVVKGDVVESNTKNNTTLTEKGSKKIKTWFPVDKIDGWKYAPPIVFPRRPAMHTLFK